MIEKTVVRVLKIDLMAARQLYAMGVPSWLNAGDMATLRQNIPTIFHELLYRREKYHKEELGEITASLEEYRM